MKVQNGNQNNDADMILELKECSHLVQLPYFLDEKYETQIDCNLSEVICFVRGKAEPNGVAFWPPSPSEVNMFFVVGPGTVRPIPGTSIALSSFCLL